MNTIYFGDKFLASRFADIPAQAWVYPVTTPATPLLDTGTNGEISAVAFSDGLGTQVVNQIMTPSDLDTSGTVTFHAYGYAATAAGSKNIEYTFYHSAKSDSENWDAAHSTKISGDLVPDSTQDDLDYFTWTETVSNLGWAANDHLRIKLARTAPSANDLVGNYNHTLFRIEYPVLP